MSPDADKADGTHRQPRQVQRIITRVVRQPGLGDDLSTAVQVALRVLDGHDVRMLGQRADGVPFDRDRRPRRDVVEHHRQLGGVGHCGEVRDQAGLRRPRVVRRHHQQAVRARRRARLRQVHAVRGVVCARTRDDACPVADRLQHRAQQRDLLVVGGGRRLASGARQHQAVAAGVHQAGGEPGRGIGVQRPVRLERSHHRGQHGAQSGGHVESAGAHGDQDYPLDLMLPWQYPASFLGPPWLLSGQLRQASVAIVWPAPSGLRG